MSRATADVVDILDPSLYERGVPYDLYAAMRGSAPVTWVDEPATERFGGGPGFWAVMRHGAVSEVSRNSADFSSWRGTSFLREQRPSDIAVLRRMMLNMDPPEHSKLRRVVNRAFSPQVVRGQLGAAIERHAVGVVDAVIERGSVDFLGEVAAEMPLLVLADVLGVPAEDRALLYDWTNRLVGIDDPEYGGDPASFVSAFTEMFAYARRKTVEKRANPTDDLWSVVANAEVDGEQLSEGELDRFFQLLVIAGNDTTRNLLANSLIALSGHPEQFAALRADPGLLNPAIEEVLRFSPSVLQFRRTATRDMEFAGATIRENDRVVINYASANRDERVFDRPDEFDIRRDPNPHISFGDGTHFCLGANLARLQTRTLWSQLLARMPDLEVTGPAVRMRSSFMNAIRHLPVAFTPGRPSGGGAQVAVGADLDDGCPIDFTTPPPAAASAAEPAVGGGAAVPRHGTPLLVLYGSNFGTAVDVARQLHDDGVRLGFDATLQPLDERVGALPTEGLVLITTATYNGTPPDNARAFAEWATSTGDDLTGVRYAVFGCGNREWARTFQDLPRLLDDRLAGLGATRLLPRGEGDAAADFDGALEEWTGQVWEDAAGEFGLELGAADPAATDRYRIERRVEPPRNHLAEALGAAPLAVVAARDLTSPVEGVDAGRVRHLELRLPARAAYRAGDHLGVLPANGDRLLERVAARFELDLDEWIRLRSDSASWLPLDERLTVREVLRDHVELQAVASRRDIERLAAADDYPWSRDVLTALLDPDEGGRAYREGVLRPRLSVLDLLERHRSCRLDLPGFLALLGPLAPRYYSISSSPRIDPRTASITVQELTGESRSGTGVFRGTGSAHLVDLQPGDRVTAFVRDTGSAFRLPDDPAVPVIMVAAGTGVAPFRGFLADRAALSRTGAELGEGLLITGARHPGADDLYGDELRHLARYGSTRIANAFSRIPGLPRVHVQDRIRELDGDVWRLLEHGARVYVCGSTALSEGVQSALTELHRRHAGSTEAEAASWLAGLVGERRYLVDVWAGA